MEPLDFSRSDCAVAIAHLVDVEAQFAELLAKHCSNAFVVIDQKHSFCRAGGPINQDLE